jgi:DUF4097 and DUF4098 domain-containing protein YvlB
MLKIRPGALLLAVAVAANAACSIDLNAEQYVGKEEKNFSVSGKAEVVLKTFDGSIQVQAWEKPQVAVTIERRAGSQAEAEALKVTTQQTGNRIVVEAVQPERTEVHVGWERGRSVAFVVMVPRETDLDARSGDGSISVSGITGTVDAHSGDGSITARDLTGQVGLHTGDGSVDVENVSGGLNVETGDGSVKIKGAPRSLRAHTGDGSVDLDVISTTAPSEDWELTTGDGGVRVALPAGFNAELDAHTGDGGIDANEWGLRASGEERNDLRGTIGSGGRTLRIRTGDGAISLTKR